MKKYRHIIFVVSLAAYLAVVQLVMGIRWEHWAVVGVLFFVSYGPKLIRPLRDVCIPIASFSCLYDFLRVIPKSWAGMIQVAGPYRLEQALFSFAFTRGGEKMILPDFFRLHPHRFLDALTALTYSLHIFVPLLFAFYTAFKNPKIAKQFAWAFLIANLFAFATYILFPVAPPWYVEAYGLQPAVWSTLPSAAGLLRVDQWFGFPYFKNVYSQSAWVFGAIPSMHAGYPVLTWLFARRVFGTKARWLWPYIGLIWFSALYLRHHYVIDLLAGALYVSVAYYLVTRTSRSASDETT